MYEECKQGFGDAELVLRERGLVVAALTISRIESLRFARTRLRWARESFARGDAVDGIFHLTVADSWREAARKDHRDIRSMRGRFRGVRR